MSTCFPRSVGLSRRQPLRPQAGPRGCGCSTAGGPAGLTGRCYALQGGPRRCAPGSCPLPGRVFHCLPCLWALEGFQGPFGISQRCLAYGAQASAYLSVASRQWALACSARPSTLFPSLGLREARRPRASGAPFEVCPGAPRGGAPPGAAFAVFGCACLPRGSPGFEAVRCRPGSVRFGAAGGRTDLQEAVAPPAGACGPGPRRGRPGRGRGAPRATSVLAPGTLALGFSPPICAFGVCRAVLGAGGVSGPRRGHCTPRR